MNSYAEDIIRGELLPEERILWADQPLTNRLFSPADIFIIPFSLFWLGFSIFWMIMTGSGMGTAPGSFGMIFPLFGLPFLLIGLYLVFGRFIVSYFRRKNTFYGVTNQRIIIVSRMFNKTLRSEKIKSITSMDKYVRRDGSGNISFGMMPYPMEYASSGMYYGRRSYYRNMAMILENVKDVDDVYRIISEQRQEG
jgi:hypothetical protein